MKDLLTPLQYSVTQACGTEPAFNNEYWDNHEEGWYVDIVSGVPLFRSEDKFDSGSGWPSFTKSFNPESIVEKSDSSFGLARTEVRSREADSHLGHVFDDGPAPNGLRYCINSASLRFIKKEDLEKEGYGSYLPETGQESALFAAGCFWGTEGYFRQLEGVLETEVGYSGGWTADPDYKSVVTGKTGHAETLKIIFDPSRISYKELLYHFFRMHDPSQLNRQGNDRGTQYRSAVFALGKDQLETANDVSGELSKTEKIVTEIRLAGPFYSAEEYHQDYLKKNPGGYCHVDLSSALDPLIIP